eukprot:TRINITY_DN13911_c0_g1_i2.p1 TRINITY_DN13911_c0_g1~~TRINITY_DN13911_c0_g1_i2.p1  ORF type:complete len:418 (-),score=43.35 TRINITY_DN13911_c0_g1_i2:236-1489(-)
MVGEQHDVKRRRTEDSLPQDELRALLLTLPRPACCEHLGPAPALEGKIRALVACGAALDDSLELVASVDGCAEDDGPTAEPMVSAAGIITMFSRDVHDAMGQTLVPLLVEKMGVKKDPQRIKTALRIAVEHANASAVFVLLQLLEEGQRGEIVDSDGTTLLQRAEAAVMVANSARKRSALYSIIHKLTHDDGRTATTRGGSVRDMKIREGCWFPLTMTNATPAQACRLRLLRHLAAVAKEVSDRAGEFLLASAVGVPPMFEFAPALLRENSYKSFKQGWARVLETLSHMLIDCVEMSYDGNYYFSEYTRGKALPTAVDVARALRWRLEDWSSSQAKFYFEKGGTIEFAFDGLLWKVAKQQSAGVRQELAFDRLGFHEIVPTEHRIKHPFETVDYLRCCFLGSEYPCGPHPTGQTAEE